MANRALSRDQRSIFVLRIRTGERGRRTRKWRDQGWHTRGRQMSRIPGLRVYGIWSSSYRAERASIIDDTLQKQRVPLPENCEDLRRFATHQAWQTPTSLIVRHRSFPTESVCLVFQVDQRLDLQKPPQIETTWLPKPAIIVIRCSFNAGFVGPPLRRPQPSTQFLRHIKQGQRQILRPRGHFPRFEACNWGCESRWWWLSWRRYSIRFTLMPWSPNSSRAFQQRFAFLS